MRIATLVLAAALPALAQAPSTFRSSAELTLAGPDGLHMLELPFEAYRDARKDMADVRVFNAAGDAVPIAWAPDPGKLVEPATPVELPMFPLRRIPAEGQPTTEVTVRTTDGTLVSIKPGSGTYQVRDRSGTGRGQVRAAPVPAAILLDASRTDEPVKGLLFEWEARPGSEMLTVRVEASDDLKSWSTIGSAPLVRLGPAGRRLLQPRVEFPPRPVKYLRVTADSPAFEPTAVSAEYVPRGKGLPRLLGIHEATRGEKPDDLVYDLGARLPVEAVRLIPVQDNAVLVATLFTRDAPADPWRPIAGATFYRLQRGGVESTSPPREMAPVMGRYWMARLAPGSSQGATPKLEAQWTRARLVFVRQGEPPFHLAFGNAQATPTALPIETVMPDYKKGKEEMLPRAKVGDVRAGPPPSRWETVVRNLDAKRVALWAVLVLGVAALGWMAFRLARQVG